jgi:hypothetical protein
MTRNTSTNVIAFVVLAVALIGLTAYLASIDKSVGTILAAVGGALVLVAGVFGLGKVGTKPKNLIALPLLIGVLVAGGCQASNSAKVNAGGVATAAQASNASHIQLDENGQPAMSINTQGHPPSSFLVDNTGVWANTTGTGALMVINPSTGSYQVWSPGDVTVERLELDPATGKMVVENLNANRTESLKALTPQVIEVLSTTLGMTIEEAKVKIQALQTAGEITAEVAQAAISLLPTLLTP